MRIASMNINGLESAWKAGLKGYVREIDAGVFCMQEIRTSRNLWQYYIPDYEEYWCPSGRPGYAGVGLFVKERPVGLIQGLGNPARAGEGRAVTLETEDMYIVNVYAPASGAELERLDDKVAWLEDLCRYVAYLEERKPVVICGDLNVAGGVRDMPSDLIGVVSAGNAPDEKIAFNRLVEAGYYDVWRLIHPHEHGVSWAPYGVKERRAEEYGWRLDYFLVSEKLLDCVRSCEIMPPNGFSDHRCMVIDMK